MKKTLLALALVGITFGAFAQSKPTKKPAAATTKTAAKPAAKADTTKKATHTKVVSKKPAAKTAK